jgi:hypothetical protein
LDAETRLGLTVDAWDCIRRARLGPTLLTVAENGGLDAARAWLSARALTSITLSEPATDDVRRGHQEAAGWPGRPRVGRHAR